MEILTRACSVEESSAQIEYMRSNFDNQDEPKLGIFWYDPVADELFGVHTEFADDREYNSSGQKTCRTLHRKIWQKEKNRAVAKGIKSKYTGDYTLIPRGRVWQQESDSAFYVTVGTWINEYPQVKQLVIVEFELPNDTEFRYDYHWDIGQGWSD